MSATDRVRVADDLALDQWYPVAAIPEIPADLEGRTTLLDEPVCFGLGTDGSAGAWRPDGDGLPVRHDFGYLWTSLGHPPEHLIDESAADEPDRRSFNACTIGIFTSAPRAVENFCDMAHLPLIHAGLLGEMPYSEIVDYDLEISDDEIVAKHCLIFQPMASAASTEGAIVDYTFRVSHPASALLYKSSPVDDDRLDVVGLFCQPVHADEIRVHLWDARLDETNTDTQIRRFGQTILAQDRPVLENQIPKELPIAGGEIPVPSDKFGSAYRRWLYDMGWTYGVIRD